MIHFIASDLDGTLLQNDAQELDPEVFDLILRLKEKGIRFIAASGRQYYSLRNLFAPVAGEISYIAENGSLCIHDRQVISRGLIPRDLGLRILDAVREFPGCDCLLSCESRCYTDSRNPRFIDHMKHVVQYDMEVVPDLKDIREPFLKMAMCDFRGTKEMEPFFRERFASEIKVVTSGNLWVDFIAPNANKGTGLASLLDYLGISPKDGISFGDQYNDVEMLQLTGISCAMANSAPGIAYYSTYVTDSAVKVMRDIADGVQEISY